MVAALFCYVCCECCVFCGVWCNGYIVYFWVCVCFGRLFACCGCFVVWSVSVLGFRLVV